MRPNISVILSTSQVILQLNLSFWGGKEKKSTKPKQNSIDLKSVIKRRGKRNQRLHNFYAFLSLNRICFLQHCSLCTFIELQEKSQQAACVFFFCFFVLPCTRPRIIIMDFINPSRLLKIVLQLFSVTAADLHWCCCVQRHPWRCSRSRSMELRIHHSVD